ncbi:MAG: 5-(carboxyamino)imidazole ribonucleotide synthase [Verrucomicrobia bacterium]|nr:5-(carboxyamino)imidazole ribonucleotide synthase [Verrucomicrobiota bacterium]
MHRVFVNSNSPRPVTIGILGGGQLALMLARTASQLGMRVHVLEPATNCPAQHAVAEFRSGDWSDPAILLEFAKDVDVITLENEFIGAGLLADLEQRGHVVLPSSKTMRLVQDKLVQKETLSRAGIPVVEFESVTSEQDLTRVSATLGFPFVLKRRTFGYDGTGNVTVSSAQELESAVQHLGGYKTGLYAEKWCPFTMELAIMITRSSTGETALYPVVESRQDNHVCSSVLAPADISDEVFNLAREMALRAVDAIEGVGTFGIEFFLLQDNVLLLNEIAPRVHNSGHYTLEACDCSQFENHIRAIRGLPLGNTELRSYAAMVNLLAKSNGSGAPCGIGEALAVPGARIHLYGKLRATPGRKMGHVTALGDSAEEALATATRAANCIHFEN